ncbi:penicillin-binding protein activator [Enterobacter ludwigii]|uniref:penicillin-binding protein activator n=1 Tax=Enterobacter ludwigii TaxID=299767 RepID=UPI003F71C1CB
MLLSDCFRKKVTHSFLLATLALFFTGCTVRPVDRSRALLESPVQMASAQALQCMQQNAGGIKTSWQLLAIRALLREGKNQQAGDLFSQLPENMDDAQHQEQSLLAVELKLAQNDFAGAQTQLTKLSPADFRGIQQVRYWQSVVAAQQGKPSATLLRALMAQSSLLSTTHEKQQNIDATWQVLTTMSQAQADAIKPLPGENAENILQGWLALRRVWSVNRTAPDKMKADVSVWQGCWPQHPAARTLPAALVNDMNFRPASVSKIALMLPLSGPGSRFGRAIQRGFEAEKKAAPSAQPSALTLYDTAATPVTQLLSQAQKDGVTLVVGPLLKNDVEKLLSSNTRLDVLALNLPEQPVHRDNVCYFALSPEDEARSAARHIRKQGKHFPLLLLPGSEISKRVARTFADEWRQQGGGVVLEQRFGSLTKLKAGVNRGIALDGSPVTVSDKGTENYRRGRTDAVYIIATPEEMGYLKPMIAQRNGSQSAKMLYASSRSISGSAGQDYRLDMEGLQFTEIPVLAGGNPGLKQLALSATGSDYFQVRLFAMGADAWMLANHYTQMRQPTGFTLKGNTGELSASSGCVINRELPWFRYQKGLVLPVE